MSEVQVLFSRTLRKDTYPGATVVRVSASSCTECFLTCVPLEGEAPADVFARAAELVRASGCEIVAQDVIGIRGRDGSALQALKDAFGEVSWPVTWIEPGDDASNLFGTQIWAVSGIALKRLGTAGTILENDSVRYLRVGGIVPGSETVPRGEQARDVLGQLESHLGAAGMTFHDVARTWFYNEDILAWYGEFNHARTTFFQERDVFSRLMPASTGIGAANPSGGALVSGLLGLKAKGPEVSLVGVESPLQCSAAAYGSSFSRAVEIAEPGLRRLFVSGTASIAPEGHTAHLGDIDAQVALTMEVVQAILASRGMNWDNASRAIAYLKYSRDLPAFTGYCERNGLTSLPVVSVCDEVCRDDLLFEIELDALSVE